jgi:hypothetical protein
VGRPAAARAILSQRIEHDLTDRLTRLPCERPREMRGLGVADVQLVLHGLCQRVGPPLSSIIA